MHPIVIMSYDKSPAINKAVQALEEAGMEVRVLNTANAKLADFLGALGGIDDDEVEPVQAEPSSTEDKAEDEPVKEPEEKKPAEDKPEEKVEDKIKEATINSEQVKLQIVEGSIVQLYPAAAKTTGAKTVYSLNESEFAFFPQNTSVPVHSSLVTINGFSRQLDVVIMPAVQEQIFKIGADVISEFKE